MPRGTRKADAEASVAKPDPAAKQQAIVERAEEGLAKAEKGVQAAVGKLAEATYKLKLAQREVDYQRSHPDLEGVSVPEATPDIKPHVDPMADDAPPWPGDAPPKDPLA